MGISVASYTQNQSDSTSKPITGILQRKCSCGGNAGFSGECESCRKKRLLGDVPPLVQPKLKIGQPNDRYEQEADRMADAVMRMAKPGPSAVHEAPADQVQRMCSACEEEQEKLRRKPRDEAHRGPVDADAASAGLRGSGQPLSSSARSFFQPRFGYNFADVRVHTDEAAAQAARSIGARAFTLGRHIAFDAGEYAPQTSRGSHLLAHELTHVVQQTAAAKTPPMVMRMATDPECTKAAKTQTKKHVHSTEHCTVTEVQENEIKHHLALDQITVAVLGSQECQGCKDIQEKLEAHCRTGWGKKPEEGSTRDYEAEQRFRLKILSVKNDGAAETGPVSRIYLDRELVDNGQTLKDPQPVMTRLSEIASSADTPGWPLGLGIGAGIGAAAGIGAGIGVAAAIAAGGALTAAAVGFGVLAGVGVLGLGIGLGALIGHLLDESQGAALDKERRQEVFEYLCMVQKHGPQGETSLARDAVTLWGERGFGGDDPLFTVNTRRRLIRDLVDGTTADREERAIIKILERSQDTEILELLNPNASEKDRVTLQDLDGNIEGSESRLMLEVIENRFPTLGTQRKDGKIRRTGQFACDAREAIMIDYAVDQAKLIAQNAAAQLDNYIADPKAHWIVAKGIQSYFPDATAKQIAEIRKIFGQMLKNIPTRDYICPGNEEVELPDQTGTITHSCSGVRSTAFVARSKDSRVIVCPGFFTTDFKPSHQANTVLHEWAHTAGVRPFEEYWPRPGQLEVEKALKNADSFAMFAHFLYYGEVAEAHRY